MTEVYETEEKLYFALPAQLGYGRPQGQEQQLEHDAMDEDAQDQSGLHFVGFD